jgi:hypothetical protein
MNTMEPNPWPDIARAVGRFIRRVVGTVLWLALYPASAVATVAPAFVLAVLAGAAFGDTTLGLAGCLLAAVVVTAWTSRLVLAAVLWTTTGEWDWRRTALIPAIRAGWPR